MLSTGLWWFSSSFCKATVRRSCSFLPESKQQNHAYGPKAKTSGLHKWTVRHVGSHLRVWSRQSGSCGCNQPLSIHTLCAATQCTWFLLTVRRSTCHVQKGKLGRALDFQEWMEQSENWRNPLRSRRSSWALKQPSWHFWHLQCSNVKHLSMHWEVASENPNSHKPLRCFNSCSCIPIQ